MTEVIVNSDTSQPSSDKVKDFPIDEKNAAQIRRQIEFYFSDSNLPQDNFLLRSLKEGDGMIPLSTICSFKRMRTFLNLQEKAEVSDEILSRVVLILKDSSIVKFSEDGKCIGPTNIIEDIDNLKSELDKRTIFCEPFPYNISMDEINDFFAGISPDVRVKSVRMRKNATRFFNGTVFVEFENEAQAQNICSRDNLEFHGAKLSCISKVEFIAKENERCDDDTDKKGKYTQKNNKISEDNYPQGVVFSFQVKRIGDESGKTADSNAVTNTKTPADEADIETNDDQGKDDRAKEEGKNEEGMKKEEKKEEVKDKKEMKIEEKTIEDEKAQNEDREEKVQKEQEETKKYEENQIIEKEQKIEDREAENGEKPENLTREEIKRVFGEFGPVKYIDYRMGEANGYIRMENAEDVKNIFNNSRNNEFGGIKINNFVVVLRILQGEEETEYWKRVSEFFNKYKDNRRGRGRGRGGRGRGGRGGRGRGDKGERKRNREKEPYQSNKTHKVE